LSRSLLYLVHLLGKADVIEVTRLLKTLRAVTRVSPEGYQRVAHGGCLGADIAQYVVIAVGFVIMERIRLERFSYRFAEASAE